MNDSQTKEEIVKMHILWAQDKDVCDQCVRPWHDGICDCGHSRDANIQRVHKIAMELIASGNELNQL